MKRFLLAATLILALIGTRHAHALCGDVTGDNQRSASDALAVLRSAVGQSVDLVCDEGPTELRLFNPFNCHGETFTMEARFNGFTFQSESFEVSDYQSVDRTEIDLIEFDACDGDTFYFQGPVLLTPGRKMTFFFAFLDPAIYEFPGVDIPAQFLIYDDGTEGDQLTAGETPGGKLVGRLYGGSLR
jgi:hypothetical protein